MPASLCILGIASSNDEKVCPLMHPPDSGHCQASVYHLPQKNVATKPGLVVHAHAIYNLSTGVGGSGDGGMTEGGDYEFKAFLGYMVRCCTRKKMKRKLWLEMQLRTRICKVKAQGMEIQSYP